MQRYRPCPTFSSIIRNTVMLLGLCAAGVLHAQDNSQQLEALRAQIEERQQQLDYTIASAKELEKALKQAEQTLSELFKGLKQTRAQAERNRQQQAQLEEQQKQLRRQIAQQQSALSNQLRSAYMTGQHDFTKMLLNQEDAARIERMLSYYRYLNQARVEQIENFTQLARDLQNVESELRLKATELNELLQVQEAQRQLLAREQDTREQTLNALEKRISSEAEQIEQLQINEQNLIQAIARAEARATASEVELAGLQSFKGQLSKPTEGRMRNLFSTRRQGQIRWKGAMFDGRAGDSVKAIHHGRILYADWLRGFGLVMVLDHGDGYMSLYGNNQALLKDVGDTVRSGEEIALVGQSGGQSQPGLYFELRHKGEAINPAGWIQP
ncbi:peptidoglycan DD-metalloendopeptidase family protein [Lacimicrobium sp. SS2-24]|uniref:murein hydrolase activator EnvC family protein n=1 Tax=Lacimicrobium sp. SS2-24 TaxID=2005569 RepID=UPI001FED54E3|nr:peptidoglycan DD-metalloendopeptidase family protein [Lacimicrobium sp. SS2-24]